MKNVKVEIINDFKFYLIEDAINDFIRDKDVIDIKYQVVYSEEKSIMSALIIYKDVSDEKETN